MAEQLNSGETVFWVCGKCGSRAIYPDGDCIVCPLCSNRYYPHVMVMGNERIAGLAPVKKYKFSSPCSMIDAPHFQKGRMANLVTGPERLRIGGEKKMSKKGTCENCRRLNMTIMAEGHCWTCYNAGRGLVGVKKDEALAAVREKIEKGEIRARGSCRSPAPAADAGTGEALAKGIDEKVEVRVEEAKLEEASAKGEISGKFDDTRGPFAQGGGVEHTAVDMRGILPDACLIILSDQELRLIEALRAGRVAIVS